MNEELVVSVSAILAMLAAQEQRYIELLAAGRCKSYDEYSFQFGKLTGLRQLIHDFKAWIETSRQQEE